MATLTRKKVTSATTSTDGKQLPSSGEDDLKRLRRAASRRFPQRKQQRMDALFSKASDADLTPDERAELHRLVREYEDGMIAKAEALNALKELGEDITPYLRTPESRADYQARMEAFLRATDDNQPAPEVSLEQIVEAIHRTHADRERAF